MKTSWLAAGGTILTASALLYRIVFPPAVATFGIVFDRSLSRTFGCDVVASLAAQTLDAPHATRQSTLTLFVTGDKATAYQGHLVRSSPLPVRRQVIRDRERIAKGRQAFLDELAQLCERQSKTSQSPLLLAIVTAIAHLKAAGCAPGTHCRLSVATDGLENVDKLLEEALRDDARGASPPAYPIDNMGIAVAFCGFAERAAGEESPKSRAAGGRRLAHLSAVWMAQFTAPDLVTVDPFCAREPRRAE